MMLILCLILVLKQQFTKLINGKVKEINIKNQSYYFFDDMIDIKTFHSSLLKIDKSRIKTLIFTILATLRLRTLVIVKIFTA